MQVTSLKNKIRYETIATGFKCNIESVVKTGLRIKIKVDQKSNLTIIQEKKIIEFLKTL